MKTKILSLLVLIAIAVVSCQKDEADKPVALQDVTFGIEHVDPMGLKDDSFDILCPDDLTPYKAVIEVYDVDNAVTLNFDPLVFFLNGKWYTQAIKLAPGDYKVTKFLLVDDGDPYTIIMATPTKASDFAVYVEEGVDIDFLVEEFKKIEIPIDVLCFEEAKYDLFGFFWFQVDRIVVWEKCFFGDLCVKNPLEYVGSLYENQVTGLQIDMPAIFEIRAFDGDGVALPYSPFTNANAAAGWGVGAPVCVEWPDNIDIADEEFTFELWIYVAVGSGFDYVLFETWTFEDDEMFAYNGEQVIDFVLGNCGFGGTPPFLQLAPYMNLPETATVNIAHPGNPGYWNLNISNLLPGGSYDLPTGAQTGWCGDAFTTVTPGNKTMSIYNSLYPETWPAGMPFNAATINKVNWMFNNLSAYGFPTIAGYTIDVGDITQQDGLVIQDAIWYIIHSGSSIPQGYNTDLITAAAMANASVGNETFTPLPGGWAAILMIPHTGSPSVPDPTKAQLIFTVVDP